MSTYAPLLAGLIALLLGLAIGKAWERYKLRDGHWIDRRRARESPHYILGLNFLVGNQIDLAIEELSKAAQLDADALEIHMILGNLYREKGQVGRAINVHQGLLRRPKLTRLEHAYVLLCLGLDFKRGGFVDRALEAFNEVLRLDSANQYALVNLEKLYEEQHQWQEAHRTREQLAKLTQSDEQPRTQAILAFLENEMGLQAMKRDAWAEAAQRFDRAIDLDPQVVPAYLNLGDVRQHQGNTADAVSIWERVIAVAPERAYLTFDRLAARVPEARRPRPVSGTLPAADRHQSAGLAGAAGAVTPPGGPGQRQRGPAPALRRARAESARPDHPPGDLAVARRARSGTGTG